MKSLTKASLAGTVIMAVTGFAHDGWIQSNVARVRTGDMVYIDMQFGNHGNMHRDYKIYQSKWDTNTSMFLLHTPGEAVQDLREKVVDVGADTWVNVGGTPYLDKNGYLVTSFRTSESGAYIMDVRQDTVVSYAPERSVKCTKSIVAALSSTQAKQNPPRGDFGKVVGQIFEIVPLNDPTEMKVGDTFAICVLFRGVPLADAHVSVIPRGKTLATAPAMDPRYDLMTDMNGLATFAFDEANYHLVVAHHETQEAGTLNGKTYTFTKYAAALTVIVAPAD
jgi:uncharacterized GH25 family protein